MRAILTLLVGVILSVTATFAWAADRRVALVIGNSAYRKFPQLPNPRNDAEDVTAALKKIGFEVLGGSDLTRDAVRDSLRQFARAAQDAEAALFYYAGHGLQYRGRNYIVPVDARLQDEFDLEYETVRVDDVVEELNRASGARILILDACRNLPLATRAKDPFSSTGLAKLSGRGMIVAYATQANQVAFDGTGRNSIFTGAFIQAVQEPGIDAAQMFQRVGMNVDRVTQGRQTPELSLSYPGQFYFNKGETEREAWPRARSSGDPQAIRDFISRFPNSFLVDDARDLIRRLESVAQNDTRRADPDRVVSQQFARRTEEEAPVRSKDDADRLAWERLKDEQRRRAEARTQAEQDRVADEARQKKLAEDRAAAEARDRQRQAQDARAEEARRLAEAKAEEARRLADARAEDARQKKLAEERAVAEGRERQRLAAEAKAEEARRLADAKRQEQERIAEEARLRKLDQERAAAEARERQRQVQEAKAEEDRRRIEARRLEAERVAEDARQKKLADEAAAAEARERQRQIQEARSEEERRQAEARRQEQLRVAEEARQRKLAEDAAASEARERQRLADATAEENRRQEVARRAEQDRAAAEARESQRRQALLQSDTPRAGTQLAYAGTSQEDRDRLAWQQLEEQQRRRAQIQSGPAPDAGAPSAVPASGDASVATTLSALKSRSSTSASALQPGADAPSPPGMRLASADTSQPVITSVPPATPFPKETLDQDRLVSAVQAELGRIGCYADAPDGDWDRDSRDALRRFGRLAKLSPLPSDPTAALLEDLKGRPEKFCPVECGAGQKLDGESCVAVARPEPKPKPKAVVRAPAEPRPVVERKPRPQAAPPQAPVSTAASAAPRQAPRAVMGVGF